MPTTLGPQTNPPANATCANDKLCIDCIYSTLIFPDRERPFFQCGNPEYVAVNLIDGSKIWPSCETARYTTCGPSALGFLPIDPPDFREWTRHTEDGVSLISARHPRPPWFKRFLFWLRRPWANKLSEDSLETIEIEVRRD